MPRRRDDFWKAESHDHVGKISPVVSDSSARTNRLSWTDDFDAVIGTDRVLTRDFDFQMD